MVNPLLLRVDSSQFKLSFLAKFGRRFALAKSAQERILPNSFFLRPSPLPSYYLDITTVLQALCLIKANQTELIKANLSKSEPNLRHRVAVPLQRNLNQNLNQQALVYWSVPLQLVITRLEKLRELPTDLRLRNANWPLKRL
ncbi:hypothetical protein QVD17_35675 [Tagetes erecta]|uniref:Uncharacterized protein n=1 Tax=Tagetes erecta TaxID=13708 RepID=A0AAD8JX30_TARER|nr:hypothetical protein QVD17_35675 [Tagetes erecta]